MNTSFSLFKVQWKCLLQFTLSLYKMHAPRGEELVELLINSLELDKPQGKWKRENFHHLPIWNDFLKAVQDFCAKRREQAPTLNEKRQWNRILLEIEITQKLPTALGYPRRAYIEITRKCNLRCPMCPQGYVDVNHDSLPATARAHLDRIIPYLELVELYGFGEPLICKSFLDWIHQWPRLENQTVNTTTNGLLLNKAMTESILTSSLNQIQFSVDAVTPETYKTMRGTNGFHQLIENIHYLVQERNRRKIQLETSIRFVATRRNIHELPEFVRLAHQLGVDFVQVQFLCAYTPDMWTQSLVYHRNLCNRMFEEAEKVAKELGMRLHLPAYFDLSLTRAQMDKGEFLDSCREPWEYIYVTNEQTVRACCCNMSIMGDLKKTGLDEIWNGKEYQGFRQQLSSDKRQYVCRFCFLNYLYADVNNIRSHLIDIKPHYDELSLSEKIHRPDKPELETVISDFIKSDGN